MCIIAIKTPNKKFMSKSVLAECFRNNPDGAGFMYPHNGEVHIRKGYMSFNSFWNALSETRAKYGDDIPYVMHFRISTQAGVQPSCTHPFPLSTNMSDLKMLKCKAHVGIAHNGIIQLTTDHSQKEYSDTMKFITDYVPFFIRNLNWWKSSAAKTALKELCKSKLAILGGDGHIERIGDFVEDDGHWYSNTTYRAPKVKSYSYWDDGYYLYTSPTQSKTTPIDTSWVDPDWEDAWNESTQRYDFDEDMCPMSYDDTAYYCEFCSNKSSCQLYTNLCVQTASKRKKVAEKLNVSEPASKKTSKKITKKSKK